MFDEGFSLFEKMKRDYTMHFSCSICETSFYYIIYNRIFFYLYYTILLILKIFYHYARRLHFRLKPGSVPFSRRIFKFTILNG